MAQTDLGHLHDMLEIHALKAAYCRYVDTKQWRRLQALFTDDVVFEGFGSAPAGASLATFIAGISSRFLLPNGTIASCVIDPCLTGCLPLPNELSR